MSHQSELISDDIHAYLAQHERKELLRLLTCGNVDDGKSTLIGRLLHDSKLIYEDQLAAVRKDSVKSGTTGGDVDLALLVDGLQAEREQGITIDVAYRYFSTARRKFIIADTPGHEQYTRNMATGASTCDLAVILIDARKGVQTQTRRHSFIVSLLGIKHIIVAINKMDLVGYREAVFNRIKGDYLTFTQKLPAHDIRFIPISALTGDNVVSRSAETPWYREPPLLTLLETIEIASDRNLEDVRFPVQYVNRPHLDFRGYSGTIAAGVLHRGDEIVVLPSRQGSRIRSIVSYDGELDQAFPPMAVTLTLEHDLDVSRGDLIVGASAPPRVDSRLDAQIVWMADAPLVPGRQYYVKHSTQTVTGSIARIHYRIDVNTLEHYEAGQLKLNEIGLCEVALNAGIAFDAYARCKGTGSFILIDRLSHGTVGAGLIVGSAQAAEMRRVTPAERAARFGQKAVTLWITGANRQEAAYRLERRLFDRGYACVLLEEEVLGAQTGFVARNFNAAGIVCLCAAPDDKLPREDETNRILPADGIEIEHVARLLSLPQPPPPDFQI
jgi:bifunctional enzyme CysN/CysC